MDKPSQPPEVLQKPTTSQSDSSQKSPQFPDTSPKALGTPGDSAQRVPLPEKPQLSELPPKPQISDLPPKPQLSDLPPKPQLSDLPPKPQLKDLPPKPQLGDIPPKPSVYEKPVPAAEVAAAPKMVPADSQSSLQPGELSPRQASEDTNGSPPGAVEMPVPLPRKINTVRLSSV